MSDRQAERGTQTKDTNTQGETDTQQDRQAGREADRQTGR